MRDHYELLRETQQGFARIKAQQSAYQATERHDQLTKGLAGRISDHFALSKSDGLSDGDPTEDQAALTRRRLKQARANSQSAGHDEGQSENDVQVDEDAPQFGGETPIDGPEYVHGAWAVRAQDQFNMLAGVAQAQARQDARRPAPRRGK